MRVLIKEKLSEHRMKTPEGFLICTDAILARTGSQDYMKSEVFPGSTDDSMIAINRNEEDVFSDATLASFENKAVTWDHPNENVTPENYRRLSVGHVRNVRRGQLDDKPVMMADIVITDADAIEQILNGEHNELSCGYDCDIVQDGDNFKQTNIRGNHVALCEQGRAGVAKLADSVEDASVNDDKANEVYHLCKKYDFYTRGDIKAYNNLLNNANKMSLEDIARDILDHSNYRQLVANGIYTVRNMMDFISKHTSIKDSMESDIEEMSDKHVKKIKDLGETRFIEYDEREDKYFIASGDSRFQVGFKSADEAEEFWLKNKDFIRERVARDSVSDDIVLGYPVVGNKNGHFLIYSEKEKAYLGNGDRSWIPDKSSSNVDRFNSKEDAEKYMKRYVYAKYKPVIVKDSAPENNISDALDMAKAARLVKIAKIASQIKK